jgi:hypothetical protein
VLASFVANKANFGTDRLGSFAASFLASVGPSERAINIIQYNCLPDGRWEESRLNVATEVSRPTDE